MDFQHFGSHGTYGTHGSPDETFFNFGVPANIEFFIYGREIGLAIDLFAIFSEFHTFGGMLSIQFGKMR